MNTILLTALSAAALLPAAPPAAPPRLDEAQPLTGKILVLTGGGTLCGDVERVADRYRVCRDGGEAWVPADKVLRLCATAEQALTVLRGRLRPDDVDGRLRLAEWCRENGLVEEARTEALIVLARNKNDPRARGFLAALDPSRPLPPAPVAAPPRPVEPPTPQLDLTAESLNQFGTRIQPILMNACAGCHNETRGIAFRLARTGELGMSSRAILHQNVGAVLAYVNLSAPPTSPFLAKAMSVHWYRLTDKGVLLDPGAPTLPAVQNRHSPAFRALEDWVRLVAATCPQTALQQVSAPPSVTTPPPVPTLPPVPVPAAPREVPVVPSDTGKEEARPYSVAAPPPLPTARPEAPKTPEVCDADEFNRRNHPERAKSAETPRP